MVVFVYFGSCEKAICRVEAQQLPVCHGSGGSGGGVASACSPRATFGQQFPFSPAAASVKEVIVDFI